MTVLEGQAIFDLRSFSVAVNLGVWSKLRLYRLEVCPGILPSDGKRPHS